MAWRIQPALANEDALASAALRICRDEYAEHHLHLRCEISPAAKIGKALLIFARYLCKDDIQISGFVDGVFQQTCI